MKLKAILLGVTLVSASLAFAQDVPIHLSRHLTEGEVDKYKLHVTGTLGQGDLELFMVIKETVNKVNPDGSATVEMDYPEFRLSLGGQDMSAMVPGPKSSTIQVDKNGVPIQKGSFDSQDMGAFFRQNIPYYDRDWKAGDVLTIDPKQNGKTTTQGTVKYVGSASGAAEFDSDLTVKSTENPDPVIIKSKSYVNIGSSTLVSLDGSIPSMPTPGGPMTDVKFHLEAEKS